MSLKVKNDITFCFTWYGQFGLLTDQLSFFKRMCDKYQYKFKLIVCNDGWGVEKGDRYFEESVKIYKGEIDLLGLEVMQDVGFNSHGCRNLMMQQVKTDWAWLFDADAFMQEELFDYVVAEKELDESFVYPVLVNLESPESDHSETGGYEIVDPKRIYKIKSHPNSHILTREAFWASGGYDLEFQKCRHGDSEFFLSYKQGRGDKQWDHELIHDEYHFFMRVPFRREDYIAQSKEKAKIHNLTVDHVRKRNEDEYRRFRKWLINFPWRKIP